MPLLSNLTEDEQRALIHKIRNSTRKPGDPYGGEYIDSLLSMDLEK